MKKLLVLLAASLVFIVSLAGCSVKSADMLETESEPMESTAEDSTSSFLAGKENDTAVSSENPTENSSSAATNSTAPKITPSTQATETQAPSATEPPAPEQEVAQPPMTVPPKQETVTPPPIETPQEIVPPPEPPAPDFEVSGYVEQAKSYGQSIGLSLDSTATACWDNPTYASAAASNISGNLASLLDWYKNSGFTGFWVWAEDLGNGAFNIYIGYA